MKWESWPLASIVANKSQPAIICPLMEKYLTYEIILPRAIEPNLIKPLALITNLQEIYIEESAELCYGIISKIQT